VITYADGRFAPGARVDPATIPGRRNAAYLSAAEEELEILLDPPDTDPSRGQYPCWLIRYGHDGPVLSLYHLGAVVLDGASPARRKFLVGAQRGEEGLALMLAGDIIAALADSIPGRAAGRDSR
jgi:hypothetical protein